MKIYDAECIVLGTVLRYGIDAAQHVLPELGHTRFVHNMSGELGGIDHQRIWQAIEHVYLVEQHDPIPANVALHLKADYSDYMQRLICRLSDQYGVYELSVPTLVEFADLVDGAGTVYQVSNLSGSLAALSTSEEVFNRSLEQIGDVTVWLSNILNRLSALSNNQVEGYQHVSTVVPSLLEKWDRMASGEQLDILPTGIPCLEAAQLVPQGSLTIVHGMSASGKTALVLQMLLGAAITLKTRGIKGAVAFNSLEMSYDALLSRCAAILARVDWSRLRGGKVPLSETELARLKAALVYVSELPLFVDTESLLTTTTMRYRATGLHASEHGPIWMLGTDYGELFADEGDSKEQAVSQVFRNQFRISRQLGCAVIAISQSTSSDRSYIAGPMGLRYSRGAQHAADVIVELWNPAYLTAAGIDYKRHEQYGDHAAWLFIQKYRDGGQLGALELGWTPEYTAFHDLNWVRDELRGQVRVYAHTNIERELQGEYQEQEDVLWFT